VRAEILMSYADINVLKPNVTQAAALRAFSAGGLSALFWRARRGPLRRIADIYVPYRLYRVNYRLRSGVRSSLFAIDAVNGSLDPFVFPNVPGENELTMIRTRNHVAALLDGDGLEKRLREKVLRAIFQQGFFKLRGLQLEIHPQPTELHIPYWLALYGSGVVHCRVMDAIRRRIEGRKASAFFAEWLAA
jgi:hypothetical protein